MAVHDWQYIIIIVVQDCQYIMVVQGWQYIMVVQG